MGKRLSSGIPGKQLNELIDYTLLNAGATRNDIEKLCEEAIAFQFGAVCVSPVYVKWAADLLKAHPVNICTVAGFPLGAHWPSVKALEATRAIQDGANEIDMVMNIGALKNRDWEAFYRDIQTVVRVCEEGKALCKVILETALLSEYEKKIACQVAFHSGAHFVKTATGFAAGGVATVADVALMAAALENCHIGIKAAGGIRNYQDARKMIAAGANRIGTSAGIQIIEEGLSQAP